MNINTVEWKSNIIYTRSDTSYIITQNNTGYHVPNSGEYTELWQEVHAYAGSHAAQVQPEPLPPPPTPEEITEATKERFTAIIQRYLDSFAQTRNYDNILSACTYATSTIPKFQSEGQYCVNMRDMVWATAYSIMDAVLTGQRPVPSEQELFAELPALVWPDESEEEI